MRKTVRERQEEARARKLDDLQEALDRGSLVIRPMTADERKRFPPLDREPRRKR